MLRKIFRLNKEKDFKKIYKNGRFFSSRFCRLGLLGDLLNEKKIGIIVGRNIERQASQRNLLKRQIRAIIYSFLPRLKSGYKTIIILKKSPASYQELREDLEQCLKKAALL